MFRQMDQSSYLTGNEKSCIDGGEVHDDFEVYDDDENDWSRGQR